MKKENTLTLLLVSMAGLIIPIAEAVVLDARSFGDLPIEGKVTFVISMTGFAVLVYHYLVIPFWTWIKRWVNGK
jgi:phosphotransferase system  glucose/maltose/N-acetylglucosamine-specific IIC component